MSIYCADFQSHPTDWYSPPGSYEGMSSPETPCSRSWVFISRDQFEALVSAAGTGGTGGTGGTTSPQFTTEELAALKYMAANPSPFNLSVEDGYLVSGSIVGVWVVAWAFRALYLTLRSDGEPTE